jgi:hypothetical protein
MASRLATELILEVRYMLRSLGVALDGPALMLGDNMSVVLSTTVPSSVLKKKHNAIAFQCVRETISARIMRFAYIRSEENVSVGLMFMAQNASSGVRTRHVDTCSH